ncbi:M28 family metallopeptidase [Aquimarina sp. 2201CG5-10]|uniref:M28 family metallopeptidase n=1 Tax=Aquimarina callyspongiae TaxID=3098150 RepID=UPI002AB4E620|nr:M28 family peptidase [Aquimarina sp. 2201CG5-10]MDY8135806.1 M28 family peptidase [Aquimarina sp. 2201CG5-10]
MQTFKMRYYRVLLLLLFITPQLSIAQSEYDRKEAEIINVQKDVVAKLTGHLPIKGKKKLKSRSSNSERKITADYLFNSLKDVGLKAKKHSYNVQDKKGTQYNGVNIYAEIPATNDSDEYIVIGAHYDTVEDSPGAVHNATGVAIAFYVASKLAKLPERKRNFIVVFFDHWKSNMIGCRRFTKKLKDDKYNIHSMHRSDYMGWDNDEDRAIELLASNISLESVYRNESPVPIYKRTVATPESRFFANFGFETVTLTAELKNADNSPFVRQSMDKYTTVNFKYLASTTDIVFKVMQSLATE